MEFFEKASQQLMLDGAVTRVPAIMMEVEMFV